ncbi:hypothetical protein [Chryseobacterium indoltheticum]|uniref:hypothetical protein n=1 Tax=Chryseobacterium indoltheticum TaxID=254 RepID=UPI003F496564
MVIGSFLYEKSANGNSTQSGDPAADKKPSNKLGARLDSGKEYYAGEFEEI